MKRMSVASTAKLLKLDAIRVVLLVFFARVIALFAIRTSERDDNTHFVHLPWRGSNRQNAEI